MNDSLRQVARQLRKNQDRTDYNLSRYARNFPLVERTRDTFTSELSFDMELTTVPNQNTRITFKFFEPLPAGINNEIFDNATVDTDFEQIAWNSGGDGPTLLGNPPQGGGTPQTVVAGPVFTANTKILLLDMALSIIQASSSAPGAFTATARFEVIDSDSNVVWTFDSTPGWADSFTSSERVQHYDFLILGPDEFVAGSYTFKGSILSDGGAPDLTFSVTGTFTMHTIDLVP